MAINPLLQWLVDTAIDSKNKVLANNKLSIDDYEDDEDETYQDVKKQEIKDDMNTNLDEFNKGATMWMRPKSVWDFLGWPFKQAWNWVQLGLNALDYWRRAVWEAFNPITWENKRKLLQSERDKELYDSKEKTFADSMSNYDNLRSVWLSVDMDANEENKKKLDENLGRVIELKKRIDQGQQGIDFLNTISEIEKIYGGWQLDSVDVNSLNDEQKNQLSLIKDVLDGWENFMSQAVEILWDKEALDYAKKNGVESLKTFLANKYGVEEKEVKAMLKNDLIKKNWEFESSSKEYAGLVNDLRTRNIIFNEQLDRGQSGRDNNTEEEITNRYASLFTSNGLPINDFWRKKFANAVSLWPKEQDVDKANLQAIASSFVQEAIDDQIGQNIWEWNVKWYSKPLQEQANKLLSVLSSKEFQSYKNKINELVTSWNYGDAINFDHVRLSNDLKKTNEQLILDNKIGNESIQRSLETRKQYDDNAIANGNYVDWYLGKAMTSLAWLRSHVEESINKYSERKVVNWEDMSFYNKMEEAVFGKKNQNVSDDFLLSIKNRDEAYRQSDYNQAIATVWILFNSLKSEPINLGVILATIPIGWEMGLIGKVWRIEKAIDAAKAGIQVKGALSKYKTVSTLTNLTTEVASNVIKSLPMNVAFESMLANPKADASWFFVPDILFWAIGWLASVKSRGVYNHVATVFDDVKKTMKKIPEGTEGVENQLSYILNAKLWNFMTDDEAVKLYKDYTSWKKNSIVEASNIIQRNITSGASIGWNKQVMVDGFIRWVGSAIKRWGLSDEAILELEQTAKYLSPEKYQELVNKYSSDDFKYLTDEQRKIAPISELLVSEAQKWDNLIKWSLVKQAAVFGSEWGAFDGFYKKFDDIKAKIMSWAWTPADKEKMISYINQTQGKQLQSLVAAFAWDKNLSAGQFTASAIEDLKKLGNRLGINLAEDIKEIEDIKDLEGLKAFSAWLNKDEVADLIKNKAYSNISEDITEGDLNESAINLLDMTRKLLGGDIDIKLLPAGLASEAVKNKWYIYYIDNDKQAVVISVVWSLEEIGKNKGFIDNLSKGLSNVMWKSLKDDTRNALIQSVTTFGKLEWSWKSLNSFLGETTRIKLPAKVSEAIFNKVVNNYLEFWGTTTRQKTQEMFAEMIWEGVINVVESEKALDDVVSSMQTILNDTIWTSKKELDKIQPYQDNVEKTISEIDRVGIDYFEMARVFSLDQQSAKMDDLLLNFTDDNKVVDEMVAFISMEQATNDRFRFSMKQLLKDDKKFLLFNQAADKRILLHRRGSGKMLENIVPYSSLDDAEATMKIDKNEDFLNALFDMSVNITEEGYMSTPFVDFFRNLTVMSQNDLGAKIINNLSWMQGLDTRLWAVLKSMWYKIDQGMGEWYMQLMWDVAKRVEDMMIKNNTRADVDYISLAEDVSRRMFVWVNNYAKSIITEVGNNPWMKADEIIDSLASTVLHVQSNAAKGTASEELYSFADNFKSIIPSASKLEYNMMYAHLSNAAMQTIRDLPTEYPIALKWNQLTSFIGWSLGNYGVLFDSFLSDVLRQYGVKLSELAIVAPDSYGAITSARSFDAMLTATKNLFNDTEVKQYIDVLSWNKKASEILSNRFSKLVNDDGTVQGYESIEWFAEYIKNDYINQYTVADSNYIDLDSSIYNIVEKDNIQARMLAEESNAIPDMIADDYYKMKYRLFDGVDSNWVPIMAKGDFADLARQNGIPETEINDIVEVIASKTTTQRLAEAAERTKNTESYKSVVDEVMSVNNIIQMWSYGKYYLSNDVLKQFYNNPEISQFFNKTVKYLWNNEYSDILSRFMKGKETYEWKIVEAEAWSKLVKSDEKLYNSDRYFMETTFDYYAMHNFGNMFVNPNTIAAYGWDFIADIIEKSATWRGKTIDIDKVPSLAKIYDELGIDYGNKLNIRAATKKWLDKAEDLVKQWQLNNQTDITNEILSYKKSTAAQRKIFTQDNNPLKMVAASYVEMHEAMHYGFDYDTFANFIGKTVVGNKSKLSSNIQQTLDTLNSLTSLWFVQRQDDLKKFEAVWSKMKMKALTNKSVFNNLLLNTMYRSDSAVKFFDKTLLDKAVYGAKAVEWFASKSQFVTLYNPLLGTQRGLQQGITNTIHLYGKTFSEIASYDTAMSDEILDVLSEVVPLTYNRWELLESTKTLAWEVSTFMRKTKDVAKNTLFMSSLEISDRLIKNKVLRTSLASVMSVKWFAPEAAKKFFIDNDNLLKALNGTWLFDYVSKKEFFNVSDDKLMFYIEKRMKEAGKSSDEIIQMLSNATEYKASLKDFGDVMQKAKTQAAVFYQMDSNPLLQKSALTSDKSSWMFMRFLSWAADKSGEQAFRLTKAISLRDTKEISTIMSSYMLQWLKAVKVTSMIDRAMSGQGDEGASRNDALSLLYLPYALASMMTLGILPSIVDTFQQAETGQDLLDGFSTLFNDSIQSVNRRFFVGTMWLASKGVIASNTMKQVSDVSDNDFVNAYLWPIVKVITNTLFKSTAAYWNDITSGIYFDNQDSSESKIVSYLLGSKNVSNAMKENQRIMNKLYSSNQEDWEGGVAIQIIPYSKNVWYEVMLMDKYYKDKKLKLLEIWGTGLSGKLEELNTLLTWDKEKAVYEAMGYDPEAVTDVEIDDGTDIKLSNAQAKVPIYDIVMKWLLPQNWTKEQKAYYTLGKKWDQEIYTEKMVKEIFDTRQATGQKNPKLLKTFDELKVNKKVDELSNRFGESIRMWILLQWMVAINTKIIKDRALLEGGGKQLFKSADYQAKQAEQVAQEVKKMKMGIVEANYDTILAANRTVGKNMVTAYYTADKDKWYPINTMISPKNTIGAYEIAKMNKNIVENQGLSSYGMNNAPVQLAWKLFANALSNPDKEKSLAAVTKVMEQAVNIVDGTTKDYGTVAGMGARLSFVMGLMPFYDDLTKLAKSDENTKMFMEKTSKDWARALDVITVSEALSDDKIKELVLDDVLKDPKTWGKWKKWKTPKVQMNFDKLASWLNKLKDFQDDLRGQTNQTPLSAKRYYNDWNWTIRPMSIPWNASKPIRPEYTFIQPQQPAEQKGEDLTVGTIATRKVWTSYKPKSIRYAKEYQRTIKR